MNMEIGELWEILEGRINWFFAGLGILVLLNLIFTTLLVLIFWGGKDFFTRNNLQPTSLIMAKQNKLEEIPDMDEIKISKKETRSPFPERYADLKESDLFVPPSERDNQKIVKENSEKKERRKPPIEGFEMVGRIYGKSDEKVTVLRNSSSGKTYVAREGEYLENTDIVVEEITARLVRLNQPDHRSTTFRFKTDEISKQIKEFVDFH